MIWISYFICAFALSFGLGLGLVWLKNKKKKKYLLRAGGVAVIVSFLLCMFFNSELAKTPQLWAMMAGSFAILLFGLVDDLKDLSWKVQLGFQALLVLLLVLFGYSIDSLVGPAGNVFYVGGSAFSVALIFVWVLSVINAVNWADGVDGLSGGIALVGGLSLFWISLTSQVNQPAIAIVAIIFTGSVLGFWWLNFPKAKIEAGTSGSYFIGFFLAGTAIIAGTKIATAMIVLAIPLVDLVWVVCQRAKKGEPITKKDFGHLHHKLLGIGWSNTKIVLSYLLFIAVVFLVAGMTGSRVGKFAIMGTELIIIVIFIASVSKKHGRALQQQNKNETSPLQRTAEFRRAKTEKETQTKN